MSMQIVNGNGNGNGNPHLYEIVGVLNVKILYLRVQL